MSAWTQQLSYRRKLVSIATQALYLDGGGGGCGAAGAGAAVIRFLPPRRREPLFASTTTQEHTVDDGQTAKPVVCECYGLGVAINAGDATTHLVDAAERRMFFFAQELLVISSTTGAFFFQTEPGVVWCT